jgi:hypothetical protein
MSELDLAAMSGLLGIGNQIRSYVQFANVPTNAAIDPAWFWHPSVSNHLIEFCRTDIEVEGRIFPAKEPSRSDVEPRMTYRSALCIAH